MSSGRAASGGASAPEPPRATRSTPECRGARWRRALARRRRAPTGSDQSHADGANRGVSWNETRYLIFDTRYLIFDTRYLIFDTRYLIFDTRYSIFDTRYLIFDTRYLIFDNSPLPIVK